MQTSVAKTWKKELFFGIGLLAFLIATIITGIYATNRADADRVSTNVSATEGVDMRIDVKMESVLIDPEMITSVMEFDNAALNGNGQEAAGQTAPNVEVSVDGAPIAVPENGSVHKDITTEDGTTSVDISTQSNTPSGDSRTRSSVNIDVDSSVRIRNETNE